MTDFINEARGEPSWDIIGTIVKVLALVVIVIIIINLFILRDDGGGASSFIYDPVKSSTGRLPTIWPMMPGGMWKTEAEIRSIMNSQTRVKDKKEIL